MNNASLIWQGRRPARWRSTARSRCSHRCCPPHRKSAASRHQTVAWRPCACPSARPLAVSWGWGETRGAGLNRCAEAAGLQMLDRLVHGGGNVSSGGTHSRCSKRQFIYTLDFTHLNSEVTARDAGSLFASPPWSTVSIKLGHTSVNQIIHFSK